MHFDVFNGDADGLCALLQLRLDRPLESTLISGIKRDISLLTRVRASPGDSITVLDISLEKNITALNRVLSEGASVMYIDHHRTGVVPKHSKLKTLIDTDANVCTSLLVDEYLQGRYRAWAVTAAFGDNLLDTASSKAASLALGASQLEVLQELGVCINYNGYGGSPSDLHFQPEDLFRQMLPYHSPFDFIQDNNATYQRLRDGYYQDMAKAQAIKPSYEDAGVAVYLLPGDVWARRVAGVYGNKLANTHLQKAHAVLTVKSDGGYMVSVRAPLLNKSGADELCASFTTGGGRKAAAGINHLPEQELELFIARFSAQYKAA